MHGNINKYKEYYIFKKLLRKCLILLVLYLLVSPSIFAGGPVYGFSVHPGIRIGDAIGDNGGFVFGFSLAVISEQKSQPSYGWNVSVDITPQGAKWNAGVGIYYLEFDNIISPGLTAGPSLLISKNGKAYFGFSASIFAGSIIYPSFSYSAFFNHESLFEFGVSLVYPGYNGETLDERRSRGFSSGPDIAYGP